MRSEASGVRRRMNSMVGKIFVWLLPIALLATASVAEAQQAKKVPRIGT